MPRADESWSEERRGVIVRAAGESRTQFVYSEAATESLRPLFGGALSAAYCREDARPEGAHYEGEIVLVFVDTLELTHAPRGQARLWPVLLNGSVRCIAENGPKQASARQPPSAVPVQHGPCQTAAGVAPIASPP
jgi:hypothetical protein